jgi:hypothetical protein
MRKYMEEKYTNAEDWESPYLILPNICFTQMHSERFKPLMNTGFSLIRLINRYKIVEGLLKEYSSGYLHRSLYLYGPSGSGKSFIVYQMACKLIWCSDKAVTCSDKSRDKTVIYVNEASKYLIDDILGMLKSRYCFCTCFVFFFSSSLKHNIIT